MSRTWAVMRSAMSDTGGLPPLLARAAAAALVGRNPLLPVDPVRPVGAAWTRGHGDVVAVAVGVAVARDAARVVQVVGNRGVVFQHGVVVRAVQPARIAAEAAGKAFTPRPVDEVVIDGVALGHPRSREPLPGAAPARQAALDLDRQVLVLGLALLEVRQHRGGDADRG